MLIRAKVIYLLLSAVGLAAFLYPFWFPVATGPGRAHTMDAALVATVIAMLSLWAVALELRRGTMNGATVALLGVLACISGLLRLFDLPGGGSGIFFIVVLVGAAFGPRFAMLLGISAMAVSAAITGGIGPWLPFQMLALGWMGAGAGFVGYLSRRVGRWPEIAMLCVYGWLWGFIYGAIMNLWSWPFAIGDGPISWQPGLSPGETLQHYWAFYSLTSLAWDAAGAFANALLIATLGVALLTSMRRYAARLNPVVQFESLA